MVRFHVKIKKKKVYSQVCGIARLETLEMKSSMDSNHLCLRRACMHVCLQILDADHHTIRAKKGPLLLQLNISILF